MSAGGESRCVAVAVVGVLLGGEFHHGGEACDGMWVKELGEIPQLQPNPSTPPKASQIECAPGQTGVLVVNISCDGGEFVAQ